MKPRKNDDDKVSNLDSSPQEDMKSAPLASSVDEELDDVEVKIKQEAKNNETEKARQKTQKRSAKAQAAFREEGKHNSPVINPLMKKSNSLFQPEKNDRLKKNNSPSQPTLKDRLQTILKNQDKKLEGRYSQLFPKRSTGSVNQEENKSEREIKPESPRSTGK